MSIIRKTKIFGIGLQRTGTTSLYSALTMLGVKSAPHAIPLFYNLHDSILNQYDAFMDNPIPLLYQDLDKQLPGSKFILTTREEGAWLKSVEWLFNTRFPEMEGRLKSIADDIHQRFYGTSVFDEEIFKRKRMQYYDEADRYFSQRTNDILKIDITKQPDWKPICDFLNLPIPNKKFPWLNASR